MRLQYLGTAAAEAWPALFCQCPYCREASLRGGKNIRKRSGAIVNNHILLDFSADLYFSKIALGLDLGVVRNVILTHGHADHFYLNNLELFMEGFSYYDAPGPLTLYGSSYPQKLFNQYLKMPEVQRLPDFVSYRYVDPYVPFQVEGITFTPLPATHGCPDSYIYLMEQDGSTWLYANDTGLWSEKVWSALKNRRLDVVSLDATFGPRKEHAQGHMNFDENIAVYDRMLRDGIADQKTRFICNHFSHNACMLHEEMEALMSPRNFTIAYDGMIVKTP